jgi:hypothetical protein
MAFIPVVSTPQAPSMQAMELAQRLQQTIAEYRQNHPALTPDEIGQAAQLAVGEVEPRRARAVPLAAAMAGVVVALGVVVFMRSGVHGGGAPIPLIAIGAAVVAIGVVVLKMRRRDR